MGLLDLIKPKSPLEKAAKAVREPYSQPEYRREAMEKLLAMGTEEAYDAVLQRFTFNASGQIADESEKTDLVEEIVQVGRPMVPALQRFIQSEKQIAFPLRALARIVDKQELLAFLVESLQRYEPLDHRSTASKVTLLAALHDHGTAQQAAAIIPYLGDHHDDAQFQAIVALERIKDESAREALCKVCSGEGHSGRIQGRAAQALLELEWPVKDFYEKMSAEVRSNFLLSKKGTLVKKGAPNA